jgi:putative hemolysin
MFIETVVEKISPKVILNKTFGSFSYKTVSSQYELLQAFQLRYQVFHHEMLGKNEDGGLDIDYFDTLCDHLIIIENKTGKVVGTYRLNSSVYNNEFYSGLEFDLASILASPYNKLELGRACIHKDYRKGAVIIALWRGIADYMKNSDSKILFGCASIKTECPDDAVLIYKYFFEKNQIDTLYGVTPTEEFSMPGLKTSLEKYNRELTPTEQERAQKLIPPLCQAYLNIGCKMAGLPAYDADFKCIDFLTLLETDKLDQATWKKFGG